MSKNNGILGIDPGKNGGMAILLNGNDVIAYTKMPMSVNGILDWITNKYFDATNEIDSFEMVIERAQPMPKQGVVSVFNYGKHFGIFEAIAATLQIPYIEVPPNHWKKGMGLNSKKTTSIIACERLFPNIQLVPEGCRKPHDGIAEAILVAKWWSYQTNKGK